MIIDKADKEIENDFNIQIEDENDNNDEAEIDSDIDSLQYTITNSKRDLNEISGISLLKDLEDKWEMIEKNKYLQTKAKLSDECYFETHSKSYTKINYKAIIDEAKRKFLFKYRHCKIANDNDEFDNFVNKKTKELERYKFDQNIIQYKSNKQFNPQIEVKDNNRNDSNNDNMKNVRKSFLKEDPVDNKQKKFNSKYRGNLFNCNEKTSIEGLVYESHNTIKEEEEEERDDKEELEENEDINNQSPTDKSPKECNIDRSSVSINLAHKLKNVFEEISSPSLTNNTHTNTQRNGDTMIIYRKENSMHSLERNFNTILGEINPSLNNRISKKTKLNLHIDIADNDYYFNNLSNEAGYIRKRNISDTERNSSSLSDKKFPKKMEENVRLLNAVFSTEKIAKRNNNHNNGATSSLNHVISSNNSNLSVVDSNHNKVYSRNKFTDSISKICKANASNLNKLIKTTGSLNK